MDKTQTGSVIKWLPERGYGFVLPDGSAHGDAIFCHVNSTLDRVELREGDRVSFKTRASERKPGATEAVEVTVYEGGAP